MGAVCRFPRGYVTAPSLRVLPRPAGPVPVPAFRGRGSSPQLSSWPPICFFSPVRHPYGHHLLMIYCVKTVPGVRVIHPVSFHSIIFLSVAIFVAIFHYLIWFSDYIARPMKS